MNPWIQPQCETVATTTYPLHLPPPPPPPSSTTYTLDSTCYTLASLQCYELCDGSQALPCTWMYWLFKHVTAEIFALRHLAVVRSVSSNHVTLDCIVCPLYVNHLTQIPWHSWGERSSVETEDSLMHLQGESLACCPGGWARSEWAYCEELNSVHARQN